ncbi:MAG: transporter [Alistipes sp.]
MKRILIIALCTACAGIFTTQAQNLKFGGLTLNNDLMMSTDFVRLSQTHSFGTARSMAMGGAFTSLGADMSSMSLNPAGLGMYRRNEISLTPMLSLSNASTAGTQEWQDNGKSRFSMANFGAALNVLERSTGSLTSLTIGFGMNRIADFNNRFSFSSESRYDPASPNRVMPTIADVFTRQLAQGNLWPALDKDGNLNGQLGYDNNPYFWPAILGYNSFLVSVVPDGTPDGKMWVPQYIGHNASVLHSTDVVNSGSINEFTLSAGANFNNIVYVGASLGIQSVHKKMGVTYQEEYGYFNTDGIAVDKENYNLISQLDRMSLYQESVLDGSGVNFKIGVIVRPISGLRLGVAFHTPTYYSLNRVFRGDIETLGHNNETHDNQFIQANTPPEGQRDEDNNSWDFTSPARLMFGGSYTFGSFAIVSIDYERDWYNGMRVKNTPYGADISMANYKADFKTNYQATNTLRAGIEVKPLPILALRVGGGYTDSMLKDRSKFINTPTTYESYYFTAGLGVNLSRSTVLDVAYQNMTEKQTPYQLFFSQDAASGEMDVYSGLYDTKQTRHYISLSLGFRF